LSEANNSLSISATRLGENSPFLGEIFVNFLDKNRPMIWTQFYIAKKKITLGLKMEIFVRFSAIFEDINLYQSSIECHQEVFFMCKYFYINCVFEKSFWAIFRGHWAIFSQNHPVTLLSFCFSRYNRGEKVSEGQQMVTSDSFKHYF
jgi:hypothetical protein